LDAESVLEVLPPYAAEIRLLLREYAHAATPAAPAAPTPLPSSRRLRGRGGGELWCLAELLATPVPADAWVAATLRGYFPNTDDDAADFPLAQQEPRALHATNPHAPAAAALRAQEAASSGGVAAGGAEATLLPGAWRWVVALVLEDDTATVDALVAPWAAARLLGVCQASQLDHALLGDADYDGEGGGAELDRGAGRYPAVAARRARKRLDALKGGQVECGISLELCKDPATGLLKLTPFITSVHVLGH
jgi:hypothetical protein